MGLEDALNQTVVYFPRTGSGAYGPAFGTAVEKDVRWTFKREITIDKTGETVLANGYILADFDFDEGDYFYYGSLNDLDSNPGPLDNNEAWKVVSIYKVPDMDGDIVLWKAWFGKEK